MKLMTVLERKSSESMAKENLRRFLDKIRFAQALLEKSIAKLERKPNAVYEKFQASLQAELNKATTLAAKPAAAPVHSPENAFLYFTAQMNAVMPSGDAVPKKPAPPQDADAKAVVRTQLCIKSSALFAQKRCAPDEALEARKRVAFESNNEHAKLNQRA